MKIDIGKKDVNAIRTATKVANYFGVIGVCGSAGGMLMSLLPQTNLAWKLLRGCMFVPTVIASYMLYEKTQVKIDQIFDSISKEAEKEEVSYARL